VSHEFRDLAYESDGSRRVRWCRAECRRGAVGPRECQPDERVARSRQGCGTTRGTAVAIRPPRGAASRRALSARGRAAPSHRLKRCTSGRTKCLSLLPS
jgi:hypothetical protein